MMYKLTARRLRQIRNAQAISARRRKGRGGGRKLSRGHKRVIGVAVAGTVIGSGAFGAMYVSKKITKHHANPAAKPGEANKPWRFSGKTPNEIEDGAGGGAAPSRLVTLENTMTKPLKMKHLPGKSTMQVTISAGASPTVKRIMHELHGTKAEGWGPQKKAVRTVIEVTGYQAAADLSLARAILMSPASQARRERRLDRGLPDYS